MAAGDVLVLGGYKSTPRSRKTAEKGGEERGRDRVTVLSAVAKKAAIKLQPVRGNRGMCWWKGQGRKNSLSIPRTFQVQKDFQSAKGRDRRPWQGCFRSLKPYANFTTVMQDFIHWMKMGNLITARFSRHCIKVEKSAAGQKWPGAAPLQRFWLVRLLT